MFVSYIVGNAYLRSIFWKIIDDKNYILKSHFFGANWCILVYFGALRFFETIDKPRYAVLNYQFLRKFFDKNDTPNEEIFLKKINHIGSLYLSYLSFCPPHFAPPRKVPHVRNKDATFYNVAER